MSLAAIRNSTNMLALSRLYDTEATIGTRWLDADDVSSITGVLRATDGTAITGANPLSFTADGSGARTVWKAVLASTLSLPDETYELTVTVTAITGAVREFVETVSVSDG